MCTKIFYRVSGQMTTNNLIGEDYSTEKNECPKNCAKREQSFIENMLSCIKGRILKNVHLCISRSEMHKIPRHDAKKRFKKYASRNAP